MLIDGVFNTKYKLILLKAEEKNNMKKSIIAGAGVAALGFAALPFAGVFAQTSSSFTDSLEVNVAGGCTLTNSQDASTPGTYDHSDREFSTNIAVGNVGYLNGSSAGPSTSDGTVAISCNTSDSSKLWTVAVDVTDLTNGTQTITGGDATAGVATSSWAIQSNASLSTGSFTSDPFATYAAAVDGDFLKASADKTATFNPSYRVYIAPGQQPGKYEGSALYTITLPQN